MSGSQGPQSPIKPIPPAQTAPEAGDGVALPEWLTEGTSELLVLDGTERMLVERAGDKTQYFTQVAHLGGGAGPPSGGDGAPPSDFLPGMDGAAAAGSSLAYSRGDHIHPSDTSKLTQTQGDARYTLKTQSPAPASTAPPMDGTAAVGSSAAYARGDHVHPSDTSRLTQTQADARYVQQGSSLPAIAAVADVAPASPQMGELWWDQANTGLYIWLGAEWVRT